MKQTAELYEFRFPDIGEGIHEGQVLEWRHRPGDRVSEGEILALVETDKVVAEIPSPKDGVLRELGVEAGEEIRVGQVLARIELPGPAGQSGKGEPGAGAGAGRGEDGGAVVGRIEAASSQVLPPSGEGRSRGARAVGGGPRNGAGSRHGKALASPVARRLAATLGVELAGVPGSGPAGRVLKEDVLQEAETRGMRAAGPDARVERGEEAAEARAGAGLQPLSTLRKTLARNMERSWQIPAAVVHEAVVVDELVSLRQALNRDGAAEKRPALSFLPFFLKVAALALKRYPLLNSLYHPEEEAFETMREVDIGFALDSEEGLVVPVIRRVEALTLGEIQEQVRRLREAAGGRTLGLADLRGGSFTVSNYGSIGGLHGRPLILPPQVAILGIGRIHEAPAVREGAVVPAQWLPLSLVFDHRLIDGAYAAGFLRLFMALLAAPHRLIAELR